MVASVNGKPITQGDLAIASDDPALSLPGVDEAQKKSLLVDYMVDLRVGAQAAEAPRSATRRSSSASSPISGTSSCSTTT